MDKIQASLSHVVNKYVGKPFSELMYDEVTSYMQRKLDYLYNTVLYKYHFRAYFVVNDRESIKNGILQCSIEFIDLEGSYYATQRY